jgi:hypothetical protein
MSLSCVVWLREYVEGAVARGRSRLFGAGNPLSGSNFSREELEPRLGHERFDGCRDPRHPTLPVLAFCGHHCERMDIRAGREYLLRKYRSAEICL